MTPLKGNATRGHELLKALEQVAKEFENDPLDADYQYDLQRQAEQDG